MNRFVLSCAAGLAVTAFASARIAIPMAAPIPQRVAQADVVLVGKVTKLEDKMVKAPRYPGDKEQGEFVIAVVKIDEAVVGAKGETHVRVGFVPGRPATGGRPGLGRPSFNLAEGQEVVLFLTPHADTNFYGPAGMFGLIDKKDNANFDKEVAEVKKAGKLIADPMAGLKSKDADDRFATAAMLISRYRTAKTGSEKTEQVSVEESKLILEALAAADWDPAKGGRGQFNAFQSFMILNLQPADGWKTPARGDVNAIATAAKAWIKDNAGKYQIKKFVPAEKAPKKD